MQIEEFKITILGPPNIGKSLFVKRLSSNVNIVNNQNYIPTLGVDVSSIDIKNLNRKIRLIIWDCAGDERYRGLKEKYHIDTKGAVIFKRSNDNSFLEYQNELLPETPFTYINDYNLNNPTKSVEEYKNDIFNFISYT